MCDSWCKNNYLPVFNLHILVLVEIVRKMHLIKSIQIVFYDRFLRLLINLFLICLSERSKHTDKRSDRIAART